MRTSNRRIARIEAALAGGRRSWVDCATPLERSLCAGLTREERTALAEAEIEACREDYHRPTETAAREAFVTLLGEGLAKVAGEGEAFTCQMLAEAGGDSVRAARAWAESATPEERQQFARHLDFGHPLEPAWWLESLVRCLGSERFEQAMQEAHATGSLGPVRKALGEVWRRRSDFTCHCPWRSPEELLAAVASD